MAHRLDRLLVLAAGALVAAIAWTSLGGGGSGAPPPTAHVARRVVHALPPAPVPDVVRLVPSTTAFLPRCPDGDLRLSLAGDGTLQLRFAGSRCHVPPLRLQAVERDASGAVVYRGAALAYEQLSGNYAVRGVARARLLGPCDRGPLSVAVAGSGLHASGTVRCGHGP